MDVYHSRKGVIQLDRLGRPDQEVYPNSSSLVISNISSMALLANHTVDHGRLQLKLTVDGLDWHSLAEISIWFVSIVIRGALIQARRLWTQL